MINDVIDDHILFFCMEKSASATAALEMRLSALEELVQTLRGRVAQLEGDAAARHPAASAASTSADRKPSAKAKEKKKPKTSAANPPTAVGTATSDAVAAHPETGSAAASDMIAVRPTLDGTRLGQSNPAAVEQSRYVSIDVECVATGAGHNDRAPCSVAIVTADERTLLDERFLPEAAVKSFLTQLTGIRAEDFAGVTQTLADVLPRIRACLGPDTVIVGQNPKSDIEWLGLEEGVDFKSIVDLSLVFEVFCCTSHWIILSKIVLR